MMFWNPYQAPRPPDGSAVTWYPREFEKKMTTAMNRCRDIAGSEELLGYPETASAYREIVTELQTLTGWLSWAARE